MNLYRIVSWRLRKISASSACRQDKQDEIFKPVPVTRKNVRKVALPPNNFRFSTRIRLSFSAQQTNTANCIRERILDHMLRGTVLLTVLEPVSGNIWHHLAVWLTHVDIRFCIFTPNLYNSYHCAEAKGSWNQ